ncbi:MAG: YlxR family protein [Polyangiaceae bacterium]|nr:YlxR family protein [Polyangiaceae bacterium]
MQERALDSSLAGGPTPGAPRARTRRCVGCGASVALERARRELVRLALVPTEGGRRVVADFSGREGGRGAWLHTRRECLERAARGGLARAAKERVDVSAPELTAAVVAAAHRRAVRLVLSARRSGKLGIGSSAAVAAWRAGRAASLVVARDARAAAELDAVRAAAGLGRVLAWSDRAELGELLGGRGREAAPGEPGEAGDAPERVDVGVLAVQSPSLAEALAAAVAVEQGLAGAAPGERPDGAGRRRARAGAADERARTTARSDASGGATDANDHNPPGSRDARPGDTFARSRDEGPRGGNAPAPGAARPGPKGRRGVTRVDVVRR